MALLSPPIWRQCLTGCRGRLQDDSRRKPTSGQATSKHFVTRHRCVEQFTRVGIDRRHGERPFALAKLGGQVVQVGVGWKRVIVHDTDCCSALVQKTRLNARSYAFACTGVSRCDNRKTTVLSM